MSMTDAAKIDLRAKPLNEWFDVNLRFHDIEYDCEFNPDSYWVGVLIELENGDTFLIGDINVKGGRCDCCRDVRWSDLVKRAKVVWHPEVR